jgi:hypothetical protein
MIDQMRKKVSGDDIFQLEYFALPDNFPWKVRGKTNAMINLMVHLNREQFYESIYRWLCDMYGEDPALYDLVIWTRNMIKWIDYEPGSNHTFSSEYDWVNWTSTGELLRGPVSYTPRDTEYSSENKPIDWHKYTMMQRIQKYFLPMCSNVPSEDVVFFQKVDVNRH